MVLVKYYGNFHDVFSLLSDYLSCGKACGRYAYKDPMLMVDPDFYYKSIVQCHLVEIDFQRFISVYVRFWHIMKIFITAILFFICNDLE